MNSEIRFDFSLSCNLLLSHHEEKEINSLFISMKRTFEQKTTFTLVEEGMNFQSFTKTRYFLKMYKVIINRLHLIQFDLLFQSI